MTERPYSVETLAERWEVSAYTIREMLRDGRLHGFKAGGKLWRISAGEVARWENGGDTGSDPTGSGSSTDRPSRRGGKRASATDTALQSAQKLKAELRLINSLATAKP